MHTGAIIATPKKPIIKYNNDNHLTAVGVFMAIFYNASVPK